jgi:hypothetical protein
MSYFPSETQGRQQTGGYARNSGGAASNSASSGGGWRYQHPLVSTLLWILGSQQDVLERGGSDPGLSSGMGQGSGGSSHRLHWKDEHDGQIAEVFEHTEDGEPISPTMSTQDGVATHDGVSQPVSLPTVTSSSSSSGSSPAPMRRNISTPFSNLVRTLHLSQ